MESASKTPKPVILELSGKDLAIICEAVNIAGVALEIITLVLATTNWCTYNVTKVAQLAFVNSGPVRRIPQHDFSPL